MSQSIVRPPAASAQSTPESTELLQAAYVSSATRAWNQDELLAALTQFRARNLANGITGMLLHFDGNFLQVLEGPAAAVADLLARIMRDPRHHSYLELLRRPLRHREFDGWSMGFRNLATDDLSTLPGWSDFFGPSLRPQIDAETPSRARRLLQSFRGNVLR